MGLLKKYFALAFALVLYKWQFVGLLEQISALTIILIKLGDIRQLSFKKCASFQPSLSFFEILYLDTFLFFVASFKLKTHSYSQKAKLISQKNGKNPPLFLLAFYIRGQSSISSLCSSFIYSKMFDKINWEFIKKTMLTSWGKKDLYLICKCADTMCLNQCSCYFEVLFQEN